MKSAGEGGNQTTRLSAATTEDERRRRALRDITAVLNLRVLCPDDAQEMTDALGLSDMANRVASAEALLEAPEPVGGVRR